RKSRRPQKSAVEAFARNMVVGKIPRRNGNTSRLQAAAHSGKFEIRSRQCKIAALAHRRIPPEAAWSELRWCRDAGRSDHPEADATRGGNHRPIWLRRNPADRLAEFHHPACAGHLPRDSQE